MDLIGFINELEILGLPIAFSHFEKDTNNPPPDPPFITYITPNNPDFFADNSNYKELTQINLELYTVGKDLISENKVKQLLKSLDMPYITSQVYLDKEKVHRTLFETTLI